MRRKEFYQVIAPLTEKIYSLAYSLLPDDLQAEQLVIDSISAYMLKEKKWIQNKEVDLRNKKEVGLVRKIIFKSVVRYMSEIGIRRAIQLSEQMRLEVPEQFARFYSLDPKVRLVLRLRYDNHFSADEIADILEAPRFDIIEKLHNGRFLMLNDMNSGDAV